LLGKDEGLVDLIRTKRREEKKGFVRTKDARGEGINKKVIRKQ